MMNDKLKRQNKQIEEHLQLVRPIALHYAFRTGQDKEDLTQVGILGLIRAAQLFQSNSQYHLPPLQNRIYAVPSFTTSGIA